MYEQKVQGGKWSNGRNHGFSNKILGVPFAYPGMYTPMGIPPGVPPPEVYHAHVQQFYQQQAQQQHNTSPSAPGFTGLFHLKFLFSSSNFKLHFRK